MSNSFKSEFQNWKNEKEEQGVMFYENPSDVNINTSLKVGDMVIFTNDNGISFGPHEVLAFCEPERGRCVYIDYDCYWFPAKPENLTPLDKYYNEQLHQLIDVAERLDWTIQECDDIIELQRYTSHGQDVNISISRESVYQNEIYDIYKKYDPSEEAMLWVDSDGHGKNGAPYELKEIIEDMEEVEESLKTLYNALKNIKNFGN